MSLKKIILLPVMLLLLFTACKKDISEEPFIAPTVSAKLSRSFYYPSDKLTITESYLSPQTSTIKTICKLDENHNLLLDFDIPYPVGNDNVSFIIDKKKVKPGYTGDYRIESSQISDVVTYYQYRLGTNSSNRFLPGTSSGVLTISKYDSRFKTLSGSYSFSINSINNPLSPAVNNSKQTTISIAGSFDNIALQKD